MCFLNQAEAVLYSFDLQRDETVLSDSENRVHQVHKEAAPHPLLWNGEPPFCFAPFPGKLFITQGRNSLCRPSILILIHPAFAVRNNL